MSDHTVIACLVTVLMAVSVVGAEEPPDQWDVRDYGAKGDGITDDTAAVQAVLDRAGKAGSGIVYLPRGQYRFLGHLNVPRGVTLKGIWQSVPAHNGMRDQGLPKPTDDGTTLLVTEGANQEDATPFLTLHTNSTLRGVVLYYPDQKLVITANILRGTPKIKDETGGTVWIAGNAEIPDKPKILPRIKKLIQRPIQAID